MHPPRRVPLPVLLTRPLADAEALAAQLRAEGVERVVISPLLRIVAFGDLPALTGGLIFTSVNAVEAFAALGGRRGLPAWVVGPRTAAAAEAAGCEVQGVAPDAATLVLTIPADAPPLTHLRGDVQRGDLAADLTARGLKAVSQVIYRAEAQALSPDAVEVIAAGPVLAPLYSPRSAALLFEAVPGDRYDRILAICLSRAVADACPVPPLAVSDRPDGPAMMQTIRNNLHPRAVEGPGPTV
ncbi:uroporphyrinogen-III synthase [Jannaschia pohangensis]|uniref:Uroporphyrinogen-III synthase n=1 Tax=Jannaschia pohangensis TaxID=390807 RepID=A0A1I3PZE7_9RHOB|nr:uroporphyrinogen-III synthase [Jannaschia pohangensis]SFJ26732.1 uroporphyrinogen-III synthase [Jannaschia pohangensis]